MGCVEDGVWFDADRGGLCERDRYHHRRSCDRELGLSSVSDSVTGSSSSSSSSSFSTSPAQFIEHRVSKLDTLAGIAIKYGVEVADIRRMNSLVTDRQMYALKTLQIPLPGRHPPSPCLSNGYSISECSNSMLSPPRRRSDVLESLHSLRVLQGRKVSSTMRSLRGYYGLRSDAHRASYPDFEVAVYSRADSSYIDDGAFPQASPAMNPPLSLHRKSRSLANGLMTVDYDLSKDVPPSYPNRDGQMSILGMRYSRSENEFTCCTPEKLLKEENGNGSWFSAIAEKGLSLRTKSVSRTNLAAEADGVRTSTCSPGTQDSSAGAARPSGVRKSCSTPSLQDEETDSFQSIFSASKWRLKPELQAFATSAITRPIFDGLSIPIGGRRNKAALD